MCAAAPCEPSLCGLLWSSFYGAAKRVRGGPKWARWCHANPPSAVCGGDFYVATKSVRVAP
eukprot:1493110-Pyramimonas_sp.AAC.1